MKTLSIKQPWAWLIVMNHKPLDNRSWRTSYRGPLLIHAGKGIDRAGIAWVNERFPEIILPTFAQRQPGDVSATSLGGVVGIAELIYCESNSSSKWYMPEPAGTMVFAWQLARPSPVPFAPCRGMLGLFEANL